MIGCKFGGVNYCCQKKRRSANSSNKKINKTVVIVILCQEMHETAVCSEVTFLCLYFYLIDQQITSSILMWL
jgi:hypothetical protein